MDRVKDWEDKEVLTHTDLNAEFSNITDNIESGADVTDVANVAEVIHGATAKSTPVNNDELGLVDTAAENVLKKLTWTNVKATLKTYFDALYTGSGGLFNIVEDTTPQLGGDLDMNGHNVGGNTEAQLDDAVAKKHAANADTDLDATFEATFVKKTDTVNVLSDITSAGANIEDAVTKKHAANADTALGAQAENLNMNTHKIVGVVDPVGAQDVATKAYGDANWAGGGGLFNIVEDTTPQLGGDLDMNGHNVGGNTEAQLDDAVAKKHAANADTDLDATFEATFVKKTDTVNVLSDITSAGANIEDAVTKKHAANTDTDLDATFEATFVKKADTVNVLSDITSAGADIEDAVTKKHAANTDTDLDATFEATFVKKADTVNVLSDITSAGADIEDAVTKKHAANTDTALGAQSENLNMNTHKIVGVVDPVGAQDVATKAYGDANWTGGGGSVSTFGTPVDNDFAKFTDSITIEGRSYSETRTDLGLVIGTNVQAYDADLTTLGGLAKTNSNFIVGNGSTWVTESAATARTSLGLGSAATRNAEDTMTDGGNLPDGHAIKIYGDANWAGGGSSDKISEGNSSVEVIDTGNGHIRFTEDGVEIARFADATLRIVGANPGLWLDETGTGNKGAYLVLDDKSFQIQRRAQNFGAYEASPFTLDIATGQTNIVGALHMNTHKITGVVDPTANQEVATKKYVDDNAGGVSDIAYASSWNGVTGTAPSKNAIWDWTKPYTESVTAPPGSYGNHDSINTAFNGNINKLQFPVKHTITGSTTAGQPTTGYTYRPEIFPHYTYLDNSSGHNQSTNSNGGRTGICAYRTKVFQQGQGDAACYNGSVYVHTTKSGSTNFLANPAGTILNGDVLAGINGAYLNAIEINSVDNGYDAAANPFVLNLNRTNNTGAKSAWWNGVRIQSGGSKAIESAFHLNGKALWGIDLTLATITNSAVALKSGQKIEFAATAGTYNASTDGGKYIKYDGTHLYSSTHFRANGQLRCTNFRIDQTATAEANTDATHYVGIEVNGVSYKVLLRPV